jgi:hypothetical protein
LAIFCSARPRWISIFCRAVPVAIGTGDGYYLVWPADSARQNNIDKLALFLQKKYHVIYLII